MVLLGIGLGDELAVILVEVAVFWVVVLPIGGCSVISAALVETCSVGICGKGSSVVVLSGIGLGEELVVIVVVATDFCVVVLPIGGVSVTLVVLVETCTVV